MLPTTSRQTSSSGYTPVAGAQRRSQLRRSGNSNMGQFFWRLVQIPQMDFEYALWQMLYLCISPRRVYRNIYYHKQTKNQWARDDPAFFLIFSILLTIAAIAYGIAYGLGFGGILKNILYMVIVDFLVVGFVVSTLIWLFSNRFLIQHHVHSSDQSVEWAYAFDIHCNSFFPAFLITYVLQFFFIRIVTQSSWICLFFGNTLYLFAVSYYMYITYLGYSALPFLKNTIVFLYPISIAGLLYFISLFGFNVSKHVLDAYF